MEQSSANSVCLAGGHTGGSSVGSLQRHLIFGGGPSVGILSSGQLLNTSTKAIAKY